VKIAYLLNTYPVPSTTFVRREIEALEALGVDVERHAVRRWRERLVEPRDVAEQARVYYLLSGKACRLMGALATELMRNPRGLARCLRPWAKLVRNANGGLVRHVAYLLEACHFRQHAASLGVDHVHAHFGTNATTVAMLSRLMGGPAYSFTAHGPDEFTDAPRLSFDLKIAHAAFVVAISEFSKAQLLRLGAPGDHGKIKVVRCGLRIEDIPAAEDNPQNHTFVCVGRLCPQKGQTLIPPAVAALKATFPDIKVVLLGDGETRPQIEAAIRAHGVEDAVELRGWATNAEVTAAIRQSRALMLPSFAEGLPIVLMEAMALRRPVISTFVAAIPELVRPGQTGWLVPPGDAEALAQAMRACLEATPETLTRMGDDARARVLSDHDVHRSAIELERLFHDRDLPLRTTPDRAMARHCQRLAEPQA
jgi:glycosyltransferase involved in cell wall biosynthesis